MVSLRFDRKRLTQRSYPTYCPAVLWQFTNLEVIHMQHIAQRVLFKKKYSMSFLSSCPRYLQFSFLEKPLVLYVWQNNFVNVRQLMVRTCPGRGLVSWWKPCWWFYGFFLWPLGQVTLVSNVVVLLLDFSI